MSVVIPGTFPFRIGLVDRGPVFVREDTAAIEECLGSLPDLGAEMGFDFLRFTPGQSEVFERISRLPAVRSGEPFPFCRDSRNALIVEQMISDDEMLATFDKKARRAIRKASEFGYDIVASDTIEDFERGWQLMTRVARRKQFELSFKPKAYWLETLRSGSAAGFARLYLCSHEGDLVSTGLLVRDGNMAERVLSALDVDLLADRPSPAYLMHWLAMRDSHQFGCRFYNLGGPGDPARNNFVLEFKRKFHPTLVVAPEPLTMVIHPRRHAIWMKVVLRGWRSCRRGFGHRRGKRPTPSDVASRSDK